jgi:hypothetical protein
MCNHGLISEEYAQMVIREVAEGRRCPESAIEELQETCSCGFFLPSRAKRIFREVKQQAS